MLRMESDLHRFFMYCIIIFLMLLMLKSCFNEHELIEQPIVEEVIPLEVEPEPLPEKPIIKPETLSKKQVFLNDSLKYEDTVTNMIYYLGKPDTVRSTDKQFYYQYSSFIKRNERITWEYIDFRTMRFVWNTPFGSFNFSNTVDDFRAAFPVASAQLESGTDRVTGEPAQFILIPEDSASTATWLVSFVNNRLRSVELKNRHLVDDKGQ